MNGTDFGSVCWRKSSHSDQHGATCVELAVVWRRSSHSGQEGGQCVELAAWRESSDSDQHGAECVEAAGLGAVIGIRDSKDPSGPILEFGRPELAALLSAVRSGRIRR